MHTFHLVGFPHTRTSKEFCACPYTSQHLKFIHMMAPRGHHIIHYGNEGSEVPQGVEHVQIFSESERSSFYGPYDPNHQCNPNWDGNDPPWVLFNQRAADEIHKRINPGDFILILAGANCYRALGDSFPGSYQGDPGPNLLIEYNIGYHWCLSKYRVFASETLREWHHGSKNSHEEDPCEAVIPIFFDLDEFKVNDPPLVKPPYYIYLGRIVEDKGWRTAVEVTRDIGAKLVIAGQ